MVPKRCEHHRKPPTFVREAARSHTTAHTRLQPPWDLRPYAAFPEGGGRLRARETHRRVRADRWRSH